jgi:hypothetical protein
VTASIGHRVFLIDAAQPLRKRAMLNRKPHLLLLLACAAIPLHADTGVLSLNVRDGATDFAIHAKVALKGPKTIAAETDATGSLSIVLPLGEYQVELSATGYKPMTFPQSIVTGDNQAGQIMLDPEQPPEELRSIDSQLKPGVTLFFGYAVDERGQPVAGVHVRVENAKLETTTDRRGFFSLSVPTPPETKPGTPATDTVIAAKPGYKTIIHREVGLVSGNPAGFFLDMKRGTGQHEVDAEPHLRE